MDYAEDYVRIPVILSEELKQATFFRKAKFWKYENEWRKVDFEKGYGVRKFPEDLLAGVILGCKISDKNNKIIEQWVDERNVRISHHKTVLYEAKLDEEKYKLIVSKIK